MDGERSENGQRKSVCPSTRGCVRNSTSQGAPLISIRVRCRTPVKLWEFHGMLFAAALREIREEKKMLSTGPFEPLRGQASKKGPKQICRELHEKYTIVNTV